MAFAGDLEKKRLLAGKVIISSLTLAWSPHPGVGGALLGGVTSPFEMSCCHLAKAPSPRMHFLISSHD